MKVRLIGITGMVIIASFATASSPGHAAGQGAEIDCRAAAKALEWLKHQQHADGSFFDEVDVPGPGNGWFNTVDALLAILSSGQDPSSYTQSGNTPVTFLERQVPENFYGLNNAGYALLAATMLEKQGYGSISKKDALISFINSHYDPATGHYGGEHLIYGRDLHIHAYAVMGLASVDAVPQGAVTYIERTQKDDGGWGATRSPSSNVHTTALAVQALVAAGGATEDVLDKAKAYLLSQRNPDGGYPLMKGLECCSGSQTLYTALAVQSLVALGADAEIEVSLRFIRSLQKPNGAFASMPGRLEEDGLAIVSAVPALMKVSFANSDPTHKCVEHIVVGMPDAGNAGVDIRVVAAWLGLLGVLMLGSGTAVRRRTTTK